MSEWGRLTLRDAIIVKHGYAFPGAGFGTDPSLPQVLTPANFAVSGGFKEAKPKSFEGEFPREFLLDAGEIVITMTDLSKGGDTLGFAAMLPPGGQYLHNQRIGLVQSLDRSRLDLDFLHYLTRTQDYRRHILNTASGSTVKHTSPGRIGDFSTNVPGVVEQRAIAEVLGALDDKIAANTALAATVDEYLSALLEMFVDTRGNMTTLSDVVDVNRSVVARQVGGTLRYVDIAAVGVGEYEFPARMDWALAPGRARRALRRGDTLWSTVRPNRRSHALNLSDDSELVASTGLAVLSPREVGFAYLYEVTRRPEFVSYLENVAEGSAYPAVRADRFLRAPIPATDPEAVSRFERVAAPLREGVFAAVEENRTLAATRDTLLPELMSGKPRIRDAEAIASAAGA